MGRLFFGTLNHVTGAINSPFDKHCHLRIDSLCRGGQLLQELQFQLCSCNWLKELSDSRLFHRLWLRRHMMEKDLLCQFRTSGLFLINSTTTGSNLWRALITEPNTQNKREWKTIQKKNDPKKVAAEVNTCYGGKLVKYFITGRFSHLPAKATHSTICIKEDKTPIHKLLFAHRVVNTVVL